MLFKVIFFLLLAMHCWHNDPLLLLPIWKVQKLYSIHWMVFISLICMAVSFYNTRAHHSVAGQRPQYNFQTHVWRHSFRSQPLSHRIQCITRYNSLGVFHAATKLLIGYDICTAATHTHTHLQGFWHIEQTIKKLYSFWAWCQLHLLPKVINDISRQRHAVLFWVGRQL